MLATPLHQFGASLVAQMAKKSACNAENLGSIPGLGRFPEEGNGKPLQYACLENSVDSPRGHKESDMTECLTHSFHFIPTCH